MSAAGAPRSAPSPHSLTLSPSQDGGGLHAGGLQAGGIHAQLGPTNTGKTHRAIRRLLGHRSGMIGLPLRLLAREVYDRIKAEKGEQAVALITGEEKRAPASARYFVCTVEAMPLDRPVEFLAVDEIQLAAHRERGHTFTDRLLHARGLRETWFMGSDTMAALLPSVVPTASIEGNPRLSKLRYAGPSRLKELPPRTALVAFSTAQVYALAERVRRERGGAAVVLGALSPRTRNAQVALYQNGEVPILVATDAIGMGLNMDVDHVCFADLHKFDGAEHRRLEPAEMAQIAGRAGRYRRDGTFGVLADGGDLEGAEIEAIEAHRFAPVTRLWWRSSDLDLDSLDGLIASLQARPRRGWMRAAEKAEDQASLLALAADPGVRALARGPAAVGLLWEVARIPDFRHTLEGSHHRLQAALYRYLTGPTGRVPAAWVRERVERLDRPDDDIDNLLTRIAYIRTWTYVSQRSDWVEEAEALQEQARLIEDRLSDALHARLTARFVDHRTGLILGGKAQGAPVTAISDDGALSVGGHALGRWTGFDLELSDIRDRNEARVLGQAARGALEARVAERLGRLLAAPHVDIALDDQRRLVWEGAALAEVVAGPSPLSAEVKLRPLELLGPTQRRQAHQRLLRWTREALEALLSPLRPAAGGPPVSAAVRGVAYAVERGLGIAPVEAVWEHLQALDPADRRALARLDLRLGQRWVYSHSLLKAEALSARARWWAVFQGEEDVPALPRPGAASVAVTARADFYVAISYPPLGGRAVRVDLAERLAAELRALARRGPFQLPGEVSAGIGCPAAAMPGVMAALGYSPVGDWSETPNRYGVEGRPRGPAPTGARGSSPAARDRRR
jgi:ATP-dependent RNA helicase SUPV3L1/SUV3